MMSLGDRYDLLLEWRKILRLRWNLEPLPYANRLALLLPSLSRTF